MRHPRPAARLVAVAALVLLAGCAGIAARPQATAAPAGPTLVGATTTGGSCVAEATDGWNVSRRTVDGATVVEVRGNATVPDANYAPDPPSLVREGEGRYVLDVASHEEAEKPPRNCTAVAGYTALLQLPATGSGTLAVRHDGETVMELTWDEDGTGVVSEANGAD